MFHLNFQVGVFNKQNCPVNLKTGTTLFKANGQTLGADYRSHFKYRYPKHSYKMPTQLKTLNHNVLFKWAFQLTSLAQSHS